MKNFEEAYKQLNTEQLHAVEYTDGPVMVIAGAGTGKTELLAVRIAHLIRQGKADPANILCLTFTNKAALNMRERIIAYAGFEAQAVTVKTFHSFASEIMATYPQYFWSGARLRTVPDAKAIEIVEAILSKLPFDNPLALKFSGHFTQTSAVMQALKLAKEAGLTPAKLRAVVQLNLSYIDVIEPTISELLSKRLSSKTLDDLYEQVMQLPSMDIGDAIRPLQPLDSVLQEGVHFAIEQDKLHGKTTKTSQWKSKIVQSVAGVRGMHKERERNGWWLYLADVYEQYRDALHQQGYYDYSDMVIEVITQLETNNNLLADVQERFMYVHIDEFQDTNAAQMRFAHLIADHHSNEGKPNILVVGDDDQTIFKFNGAELSNMLEFEQSYPSAKKIVLTQNYRSTQQVIDSADRIIAHAHDRLTYRDPSLQKVLHANTTSKTTELEHRIYQTAEHQYSLLADDIKQQFSDRSTMAVIARKHSSLEIMSGLLSKHNIPIRYERQQNIIEHEAFRIIYTLAKIITSIPNGNTNLTTSYLRQAIQHPMWGVESALLWKFAVEQRHNEDWLSALQTFDDEDLSQMATWLIELSALAETEPMQAMIEYIIGLRSTASYTSPFRSYYVEQTTRVSPLYVQTLSAIAKTRHLLSEYAGENSPKLSDFVKYIDIHEQNSRPISDSSVFATETHAVELLSVHKAKGLEFDTVYVIDAIEQHWSPSPGGRKPPINLPLQPMGDDMDDYARLMYVAATRAKQNLIISSYALNHAREPVLATPLLRDAMPLVEVTATAEKTVAILEDATSWPRLESNNEQMAIRGILDSFSLSVTSLLNYLDITKGGPRYFLERNILRLPELKSPTLSYGTAIHAALRDAQEQINGTGALQLSILLQSFEAALRTEQLPGEEFVRRLERGKKLLTKLERQLTFQRGAEAEKGFKNILLSNGARLSGAFDLIILEGNNALITDYKTGSALHSFDTRNAAKQKKAWQHKTQLTFYALLAQASGQYPKSITYSGRMLYVEAEKQNEFEVTFTPSQQEIDELELLIGKVWHNIMQGSFSEQPQYSHDIQGILSFVDDLKKQ